MQVTVHYLFSKNKKIGSKIIRWGTRHLEPQLYKKCEIPSHVAILVNEKWVFESTLETGVRRISYKEWLEHNTEVAKYKCQTPRTITDVLNYFRAIKGKKYDYKGVIYFGIRVGLNKFFGMKIPKKNKWASDNKYFCCEVMGEMLGLDYEMTSPVQVMVQTKNVLN